MELVIHATARTMGETAGGIVAGLLKALAGEARQSARLRTRARSIENRMEKLFPLLGRTCYRLMGQGKNFLREKRVVDLIERIETCQTELKRIRQMATA